MSTWKYGHRIKHEQLSFCCCFTAAGFLTLHSAPGKELEEREGTYLRQCLAALTLPFCRCQSHFSSYVLMWLKEPACVFMPLPLSDISHVQTVRLRGTGGGRGGAEGDAYTKCVRLLAHNSCVRGPAHAIPAPHTTPTRAPPLPPPPLPLTSQQNAERHSHLPDLW